MTNRRGMLFLALLGFAVGIAFQGNRGLYDSTEGRYAEVAREMLVSGDFVEPTLNGRAHWTKPPLTYWTIAAGLSVFGRNAWGARFFNAIAFCLTTLVVATIGTRLWGAPVGHLAGLVYLACPLPVWAAGTLTPDTLLTLWTTLTVLAYVTARQSKANAQWWVRAMYLALGIGFMVKGPPALLPLVPLVLWHRSSRPRFRLIDPLGITVCAVVGFWWYALVALRHNELFGYFVRDEIVGRNVTGQFQRHPEWYAPVTLYGPALLIGGGAWWVYAVGAVLQDLRHRRHWWRRLAGAPGTPRRLLVLWMIVPLVVLCFSKSRLELYVLPYIAPFALATAALIVNRGMKIRRAVTIAVVSIAVLVGLKAASPIMTPNRDAHRLYTGLVIIGGPGAAYALVDEAGLHGLQFYFDGMMERLSLYDKKPWADETLGKRILAMQAKTDGAPYVFVASPSVARVVVESLERANLEHTIIPLMRRQVVVTEPVYVP